MTDLYSTLGVDRTASADEIRKAYRRKAMDTHPDREGGNDAAFKEVQRAGDVLLDPGKRREYDETGRCPGDEPTASERVQAMLVDIMDKLGEPNFRKVLRDIKRDLLADRKKIEQSVSTAKGNVTIFEKSVSKLSPEERTPEIENLIAMRRKSLQQRVTQAQSTADFMEETMRFLSPISASEARESSQDFLQGFDSTYRVPKNFDPF